MDDAGRIRVAMITEEFSALEPSWDNSLLFAAALARRGHEVVFASEKTLRLDGAGVRARFFRGPYEGGARPAETFEEVGPRRLAEFDLALLRADPPVDAAYLSLTYVLERAGTLVLNDPATIRRYNEKIAILDYGSVVATAVVFSEAEGLDFLSERGEIPRWIAKPLNAFGGMGVAAFAARDADAARAALARAGLAAGEPVMLQEFNEAVAEGDKRMFLLEGRPIGWVNRVPKKGEFLANIHAGAITLPFDLTDSDRAVCDWVARTYPPRELPLICIDVIGEKLSEVNVTCPSGMIQINRAMNRACEVEIAEYFERRARESRCGGRI